ncbi:hypothetical protein [Winogradskyella thalassocola]|uniref:Uncharacterized protein n=1 Tax=Winogradskyella thalassocola TaxID=262004 RepID=A0A1G8FAP6_9FLAO|nr:hypothetical protein [Winogradskyella thalassocola]SDH79216.1 hypothetical protein SAMN04489796_104201 [Winogradskyella thalassocola]
MKKLLLSVAILVGATLILSQDNSNELKNVNNDDVAIVQVKLPTDLKN